MSDRSLESRFILVVEDEYILADDLRKELEDEGSVVLGPVATVKDALAIIEAEDLDAAVVDINLGSENSYLVADALIARHVPFVFATGYSDKDVPACYANIRHCEKPSKSGDVLKALSREVE